MAQNTLLTLAMITRESMMVIENNRVFTKRVRRDFSKEYGVAGAKIGTVLNIRKPPRSIGRLGQALSLEDQTETSVPLTLTTQFGVDFAFSSQDLALSIDDFSERFLKPNIATVANRIDFDGLNLFLQVSNEIGTPGTVPNALLTYLDAKVYMDNEGTPIDDDRTLILSSQMEATIVDALKGLFQSSERIGEQYDKGRMGKAIGCTWYMDQNVRTFTVGTQGGTPTVSAANQTGNSITTTGWTASTAVLNAGDIVTFAGCYAVNPQNRQSTGYLREFVVTAPVTSGSGAGAATIPISSNSGLGVVTSGQFQNCTASPTNGGAVTVNGASATQSSRGLMFHKEAFCFASADLPRYEEVKCDRVSDSEVGTSIRLISAYDINLDRRPTRSDVLYGYAAIYPEFACRIAS